MRRLRRWGRAPPLHHSQVVRLGAAAGVDREARLLAAVAGIAPLPVPEPGFTIPGRGCLAYRRLPGVPLLGLPESRSSAHTVSIAATLGELFTALCAAPVELMAVLGGVDDRPLDQWRLDAAQTYAVVAGEVPVVYRRPVEAFLEAPPPAGGWVAVFSTTISGSSMSWSTRAPGG
jgi:hypothetical protein